LGGGREDARLPAREGAHVRHEHLDLLRRIAEEGEMPVTPIVLVLIALVVVVPLAALLILLADGVAHFE
jgi:hypothetical protein